MRTYCNRNRTRRARYRTRGGGFTLVEILMVVAIVGILVSLVSVAAFQALKAGRRAKVQVEIDLLAAKVEEYKGLKGEYPPNCGNGVRVNRIMQHLKKAFPRFQADLTSGALGYTGLRLFILQNYNYYDAGGALQPLDLDTLDQAEALVFWLGGLPTPWDTGFAPPQRATGKYLYGFNANPSTPFALAGTRTPGIFEFEETRLQDADFDGWLEYRPEFKTSTPGVAPPYVYFDASTYGDASALFFAYPSTGPNIGPFAYLPQWGAAVPYLDSAKSTPTRNVYVKPATFQIICAGADLAYGLDLASLRYYPSGLNYSEYDLDNQTNIATGRLQDDQP